MDARQLAERSVPPSTLSLLGLLRHLGEVERDWRNWISQGEPEGRIYGPPGSEFDIERPDDAQVSQAPVVLHREQQATDLLLEAFEDLGQRVGREQVVVRELMVHRIEEYARHGGHADLLRECLDGRVGQ
ncbi:MAG: mycothiol transferase [Glutamicibacter arilaitensis]